MSFILLGILNSQVEAEAGGAYELISTQVLSSTASSVTFSSIPQTYKHLQIRTTNKETQAAVITNGIWLRLNGDSGANYSVHMLRGNGSSVQSFGGGGQTSMFYFQYGSGSTNANVFSVTVADILDYASASKNTTVRGFSGLADSTSAVTLNSGGWYNTAAVTQLDILSSSSSFVAGSRFSLYGIRG